MNKGKITLTNIIRKKDFKVKAKKSGLTVPKYKTVKLFGNLKYKIKL